MHDCVFELTKKKIAHVLRNSFFLVSCPTLPDVSVTTGDITLFSNGSITHAAYTCPMGYEVKGDSVLTCLSTGQWDFQPSECGKITFESIIMSTEMSHK